MKIIVVVLFVVVIAISMQLVAISLYFAKERERNKCNDTIYSPEVIVQSKKICDALTRNIIKKHTIVNDAEKYDSKKTLEHYKVFLDSVLMNDLSSIKEERYNG